MFRIHSKQLNATLMFNFIKIQIQNNMKTIVKTIVISTLATGVAIRSKSLSGMTSLPIKSNASAIMKPS